MKKTVSDQFMEAEELNWEIVNFVLDQQNMKFRKYYGNET